MTHRCAAIGCDSVKNGKTSTMFHRYNKIAIFFVHNLCILENLIYNNVYYRFPLKDTARMKEWLKLCPSNIEPEKKRHALCSKHFRRDQYLNVTANKPRLIHNAVPFQKHSVLLSSHNRDQERVIQKSSPDTNIPKSSKKSKTSILNHQSINESCSVVQTPMISSSFTPVKIFSSNVSSTWGTTPFYEEPEDDGQVTIEVVMKPSSEGTDTSTTSQGIILENINLKLENQTLQSELTNAKKKLLSLNQKVHQLSELAKCQCPCESCTIQS